MQKNNIDMSEVLKIRLAARCEAAGRPENEDNFQVAENLSVSNAGFTTDKVFSLGPKGTLLLVCDGMGGMNAGEVASAVGVETIKSFFVPQLLTDDILASDDNICMYMKRAIVKADSRVKEEASKDAAKQGMGSTAVMAWLLGQKVYVAWCGDSRCYRYNPATGLEQLSHDHSYVQDLVDTEQLSADLAFDHPNKNIITRSLGDPRGAAKPDAKVYNLRAGDVIMLCSDGLSDSLRDNEIAQAIGRSLFSMEACRDALWNDSKQAGWHDNVTVVLAQVLSDNAAQAVPQQPSSYQSVKPVVQSEPRQQPSQKIVDGSKKRIVIIAASVLLLIALAIAGYKMMNKETPNVVPSEQITLDQVKPDIDRIINTKSTNTDNMESELLSIVKKAQSEEVNSYISRKLEEKKVFIECADDELFESVEEKKDRLNQIDEITSEIFKK